MVDVVVPGSADDGLVDAVADLLGAQVRAGAALGWVEPPPRAEIAELIGGILADGPGEAACAVARDAGELVGFGYWRRYALEHDQGHRALADRGSGGRHVGERAAERRLNRNGNRISRVPSQKRRIVQRVVARCARNPQWHRISARPRRKAESICAESFRATGERANLRFA